MAQVALLDAYGRECDKKGYPLSGDTRETSPQTTIIAGGRFVNALFGMGQAHYLRTNKIFRDLGDGARAVDDDVRGRYIARLNDPRRIRELVLENPKGLNRDPNNFPPLNGSAVYRPDTTFEFPNRIDVELRISGADSPIWPNGRVKNMTKQLTGLLDELGFSEQIYRPIK